MYYVDGEEVAVHEVAISAQMRPIVSDFSAGGGSVIVEYLDLYPVTDTYPAVGTFTSRVFDAGSASATWQTLTAVVDAPEDTGVSFEVRTGTTPTPDASWTDWQPVGAGGALPGPAQRRYLQYRATLTTTNTSFTPFVESVTLGTTSTPGTGRDDRWRDRDRHDRDGHVLEHRHRRGAVRVQPRQRDVPDVHEPARVHGPVRRLAHRPSARDRPGRNIGTAAENTFVVDARPRRDDRWRDRDRHDRDGHVLEHRHRRGAVRVQPRQRDVPDVHQPARAHGLSDGSHTVRVRAIDQTGNVGTAAESTFVIDATAPAATIGDVTVTGTTARVTFSSEAGARFECSLDNGPFQACTSRASTPASRPARTPSGCARSIRPATWAGRGEELPIAAPQPPDTTAPKVRPAPRSVFVSNKGRFKVRLRCPSTETRCRIVLRIRYRGKTVASKAVTVLGGRTARVTLRLKPSARVALNSNGLLRVTAVTTARDAAGNRATTQTRMRLRD